MARRLQPKDGYLIMNELVKEATGQSNIKVNDLSSYVSAGETALATGLENVFNALGIVIGRTFVATRPYKAKLALMNAINTGEYTSRFRKISFYSRFAKPSGFFNTDLYTNLANGFTNGQNRDGNNDPQSTKSMWEQCQGMPFEMTFGGSTVWDHGITMYESQMKAALRDPAEMAALVNGILTEHSNDIESTKEAFNRMTLLSRIGAAYLYNEGTNWSKGGSVNLTTAFNAFYGTNYTSAQLRSTYLNEFLAFMVATIRQISDFMTERSTNYHVPFTKTVDGADYSILRHTPYDRQRIYLYEPLFRFAEALVLPEIFRPEYLDLNKQYEGVSFWQDNQIEANRPKVQVRVPFYNPATGQQESSGDIKLDYVVGCISDVDALMVDYQMESAYSTPVEARKGYRTTWLHFAKNAINDPSENFVLLYMDDSGVTPEPGGDDSGSDSGSNT